MNFISHFAGKGGAEYEPDFLYESESTDVSCTQPENGKSNDKQNSTGRQMRDGEPCGKPDKGNI